MTTTVVATAHVAATSAPVKPVQAYDSRMRATARRAGHPLLRRVHTLYPDPVSMPPQFVAAAPDGTLSVTDPTNPAVFRPIIDTDFVIGKGEPAVVCLDARTKNLFVRAAAAHAKTGDDDLRRAAKQLAWLNQLDDSVLLASLTRLLSEKYWLPAGDDLGSVTAWATAFGHTTTGNTVTPGVAAALLDRIHHDTPHLSELMLRSQLGREVLRIRDSEYWASRSFAHGGAHSHNRAYTDQERLVTVAATLAAIDPRLVERNIVTGAVTPMVVGSTVADGRVRCEASTTPPFKVDSAVYVMVRDSAGDSTGPVRSATFRGVEVVADVVQATLDFGVTGRNVAPPAGSQIVVTEAAYLSFPRKTNRVWTSRPEDAAAEKAERAARWAMPLEVIVAAR